MLITLMRLHTPLVMPRLVRGIQHYTEKPAFVTLDYPDKPGNDSVCVEETG